jgi:hypothetical protein
MLNQCQDDNIILDKQINKWREQDLDKSDMAKNLKLAIVTAKGMGHAMKDVTPETFLDRQHLETLACLYEILKDYLLKDLRFEKHPSLINLLTEDETVEDFGGIS